MLLILPFFSTSAPFSTSVISAKALMGIKTRYLKLSYDSEEKSADGNTNWTYAGESTKASITLTGLPTATKIWFKVAAVGAKGQGPWSDPAKGLVS